TEAVDAELQMFGEERLNAIIRKSVRLTAQEILTNILEGVREFTGDVPQFDDITLMVIKGE
ncbi:MAG: SpoIIE family protein phosphatase, partial [Actinomycetes bacterium]